MSNQQGFTLLEMLLSVSILTLLVGIASPIYGAFVNRNDLDLTAQSIAQQLRRAQTYARSVSYDDQWGVSVQSSQAVLYRGTSYAARTTAFDESTTISNITMSGLTEVNFAKLSATPNTTGTITLTASTGDVRTITINAKGMVAY